ncbi:hypothetical protein L9F63_003995 [Diploptera punctata]|uniref:Uncharacterized protein n=1 Tax=Diploptera punctata TaxID=6984 RepID=A0AAD8E7Q0_DIPPU|nr:hypothetical protein L9F63_003995 [Diploptera punctata]
MAIVFIQNLVIFLILSCAVNGKHFEDFVHLAQSLIKLILLKYFTQDLPVLFLLSNSTEEESPRSLNVVELPHTIRWVEDITLQIASENYLRSILMKNHEDEEYYTRYPYKGHILFTNALSENFQDTFFENVQTLRNKPYWNPRSNFVVFACGKLEEPPEKFADTVLSSLKNTDNIINAVLFLFTGDSDETNSTLTESVINITSTETITKIYAYTLLPYINGACNVENTVIIGKWSVYNANGNSFEHVDFFPSKLPKRFMGCVLNIGGFGPEPYVIKQSYTTDDGENTFVLQGLGLELINLFSEVMNMTPRYHEPFAKIEPQTAVELLGSLMSGETDIVGGCFPRIYPITTFVDVSFPMLFDTLKYVVPCPKSKIKTEKIIYLFSLSTWTSIGLVFTLVSVLFWMLSNYSSQKSDVSGFKLLAQCFSAAWAVLLGISVPQMPLSPGTRNLFIIYVWYCFAISTVFQAYFTTYLVEPGYEARLETLDDVKRAGLNFRTYDIMDTVNEFIDISEVNGFEPIFCTDIGECVSNVMFKRQSFSAVVTYFPSYIASLSGVHDQSKVVCFLDDLLVSIPMGAGLSMGNVLLHNLNDHIMHCIEAGILVGYWSKIKHEVNLKSNKTEEDSEYVVFSLTHLFPGFMLLFVGNILSVIIFVCELIHYTTKESPLNMSNDLIDVSTYKSNSRGSRFKINENLLCKLPFRHRLRVRKLRRIQF